MAPSIYPQEPGTEYGPCAEPCEHIDCARSRRDAAQICRICGTEIGYGRRVYQDAGRMNEHDEQALVHAVCLEREYEQERQQKKGRQAR